MYLGEKTETPVLLPAFKSATVKQENINLLIVNRCMVFLPCEIKDESSSESLSSSSLDFVNFCSTRQKTITNAIT